MKKLTVLLTVLLLVGCSSSSQSDTPVSSASSGQETIKENTVEYDSYRVAVKNSYTMKYVDDSSMLFSLDGTFEKSENDTVHVTQYIQSNGMNSHGEGWYYDGKYYNSLNSVNYYETMSVSQLKESMLVPMDPYPYENDEKATVKKKDHTVEITLSDETGLQTFYDRYDIYGLSEMEDVTLMNSSIIQKYDENDQFISEESKFDLVLMYNGQAVDITYQSSVVYADIGSTTVEMTDEKKSELNAYVEYSKIDTSVISEEEPIDDSPGNTAEETFRKRLMGRLGYTEESDGVYSSEFNDHEKYEVDFNLKTFRYSNYSITYVYTWKGDFGSLGGCSYDFAKGVSSSDCKDETIEGIQKVKSYLEMELFYCGLSIDDLKEN